MLEWALFIKSSVKRPKLFKANVLITNREITNGYDKIADKIYMSEKFYQTCINIAGKIHGDIIDIGCGQGFLLEKITKNYMVNSAVGIDISPKLCLISKARNPEATILNLSAEEIDNIFADNSFDFVFLTEVLEHLLFPDIVLTKVSNILKPTGKLILTVPNRDWIRYEKYKAKRRIFQPVDDHFYRFTEIIKLLKKSNFELEKILGEDMLFHSSGVKKRIDHILLLIFPQLNRKMKRLVIRARNKKSES